MTDCPCGGERWPQWHKHRRIPVCPAANAMKAAKKREQYEPKPKRVRPGHGTSVGGSRRPWEPGTSILVEENEAL